MVAFRQLQFQIHQRNQIYWRCTHTQSVHACTHSSNILLATQCPTMPVISFLLFSSLLVCSCSQTNSQPGHLNGLQHMRKSICKRLIVPADSTFECTQMRTKCQCAQDKTRAAEPEASVVSNDHKNSMSSLCPHCDQESTVGCDTIEWGFRRLCTPLHCMRCMQDMGKTHTDLKKPTSHPAA